MQRNDRTSIAARRWRGAFLACAFGFAASAQAVDLVIYDDTLQNSFLNFSYGGGSTFGSTAQAHQGVNSILFDPFSFNAVKVANDTQLFNTAQYPRLHFWLKGDTAACQGVTLILERNNAGNDVTVASGPLSGYFNCATIGAGWNEITVDFTAAPLAYNGTWDRLSFFNGTGADLNALYLDDLSLQAAVIDLIFKNGFDGSVLPPPACGMQDEHDVTAAGMLSDRFRWCDSAGQPRAAVLAHNDAAVAGPGGSRGGELRQFEYKVGAATRTVNASSSFTAGFGYPVSHPGNAPFCTGVKIDNLYNDPYDDNGLIGHLRGGTYTRVFEGRHHAIHRFTTTYPLYCSTVNTAPLGYIVPVTIEWTFASGKDHPLWSITWDLSGVPVNKQEFDSRAPYGELLFDGSASEGAHSVIAGVAWGDGRKFTSTTNPVSYNSAWTWNVINTVPYVKLWTTTVDATMGTVQTQTISQQDAGGYFGADRWGTTSANGNACAAGQDGASAHSMPCSYNWPYQSINYSMGQVIGGSNADNTNNTRLAWGTEFGFLGLANYHVNGSNYWGGPNPDSTAPGWPKKSYSQYVVLGTHTGDPVGAQVTQIETVQSLTLSINSGIGSVVTSGPAGVNRVDNVTYAPAGWNHVYGALSFNASGNALNANIAVGAGTLTKPLIIVRGYTSANYPSSVKFNNTTLAIDVDYFPSLRAGSNELWLTLNRDLTGAVNKLEIAP